MPGGTAATIVTTSYAALTHCGTPRGSMTRAGGSRSATAGVIFRYLAPRGHLAFALQEATLYVDDSCLEVARRFSPTVASLVAGFSAPSGIAFDAQGSFLAESTIRDCSPA
jgi:hypothetical protein